MGINGSEYTFRQEYEQNIEVKSFGSSSLSIFALAYYLHIDDIEDFAVNAINENNDDKKVDICYIDLEAKKIIIAQNYISNNWQRKSAPSNKASDLNTAISWLFIVNENKIPKQFLDKAKEVRAAVKGGEIEQIEILYIHNCPESKNVFDELSAAADSLSSHLKSITPEFYKKIQIIPIEMGINYIERLYMSRETHILINDWIDFPTNDFLEFRTKDWFSVLTTVPANWIKKLFTNHGDSLFSANYRNYLGSLDQEENINSQIITTASNEPENFWVYNNGITALTYEIDFNSANKRIRGISIINGAQTSGALGSVPDDKVDDALVLIRLVQCKNADLIDNIILYNNTQNAIKPEDIRSKDGRQCTIHDQFKRFNIDYQYRRSDKKITKNTITGKSIAAPLCAFHGDPQTAYRNPKKIFKDDSVYERVFRNDISIRHIFLIRALSMAIDKLKSDLKKKIASDKATEIENNQYKVLKYSASKHFLLFIIGASIEEIMGTKITDRYQLKCNEGAISINNRSLIDAWEIAIKTVLPFVAEIINKIGEDGFYDVPRSVSQSKEVASRLRILLSSFGHTLDGQFNEIRNMITL